MSTAKAASNIKDGGSLFYLQGVGPLPRFWWWRLGLKIRGAG